MAVVSIAADLMIRAKIRQSTAVEAAGEAKKAGEAEKAPDKEEEPGTEASGKTENTKNKAPERGDENKSI
jgi:hypothetical protein